MKIPRNRVNENALGNQVMASYKNKDILGETYI